MQKTIRKIKKQTFILPIKKNTIYRKNQYYYNICPSYFGNQQVSIENKISNYKQEYLYILLQVFSHFLLKSFATFTMANNGEQAGQVTNETAPISYGYVSNFNFWEVNYYKTTVKRMEDGAKLCEDFMKMVSERAEIEMMYCNKMKG